MAINSQHEQRLTVLQDLGMTDLGAEAGFQNFLKDMGPAPSLLHSIERVNNDLGYTAANCVWATRKEQNRNTRQNVFIEHNGENRCVSEWAEMHGVADSTLRSRLNAGTPFSKALGGFDLRRKSANPDISLVAGDYTEGDPCD